MIKTREPSPEMAAASRPSGFRAKRRSWREEEKNQTLEIPKIKVPAEEVTKINLAEDELPEIQVPEKKATQSHSSVRSFFRLNQAEVFRLLQLMDPLEFKLFFFLSMKAWGWDGEVRKVGDGTVRSSVSYAAKGAGISESSVDKHMNKLIDRKLVEKIFTSFKQGNTYRISSILLTSEKVAEVPEIQVPEIQVPEIQVPSYPKNKYLVTRRAGTNIDSRSIESLSLSKFLKPTQLSELEARWLSFMKKEREREEKGLLKLCQQKPEETETLFKAFQIILKEQDEYGEIKSAISVLESNYSAQYRTKAIAAMRRQEQKDKENQGSAELKAQKAEEQDSEAQIHMIRMRCFESAFPEIKERKDYILKTCKRNSLFSQFDLNSHIAISHAVSQWAQGEGSKDVLFALEQKTLQSD